MLGFWECKWNIKILEGLYYRHLRLEHTVSLGEILRKCPPTATEKPATARLKLGVQLAYAVLHVHDTHWLKENWGSEGLYFVIGPGGPVFEQPLLQQMFQLVVLSSPTLQKPVDSVSAVEERDNQNWLWRFVRELLSSVWVLLSSNFGIGDPTVVSLTEQTGRQRLPNYCSGRGLAGLRWG